MTHFIGYHATGSNHRVSLQSGLKSVESAWDPESGGELGQGFYVTKDYKTSCAYGVGIAQGSGALGVDIWKVECPVALEQMKNTGVETKLQWKNVPRNFCSEPYYWLYNASENPPVQIKFNNWALGILSISLYKQFTLAEADAEAD
jgi:hypothetical protein